jgi:hypothetical protein
MRRWSRLLIPGCGARQWPLVGRNEASSPQLHTKRASLAFTRRCPRSGHESSVPSSLWCQAIFEKYEHFSRWMFSYAQDFTPDVEIGSIERLFRSDGCAKTSSGHCRDD